MNQHFRTGTPLVLTLGEMAVDACKSNGVKHCIDVTHPASILTSDGQLRPELAYFDRYVILIPHGGEDHRDMIAMNLGDERCRWAYLPEDPADDANLPIIISGAQRMWTDEVARLSDIPEPGPVQTFKTGFGGLDDYGIRIVTPAFMPIVGPYGSGKSVFLRQLLINLWRMHGWKFAITAFEEKVRPRFERDLMRHLLGMVEGSWTDEHREKARAEINEAAVFIRRKRNTTLDIDRLIDRIDYAARVYGIKVCAIDPFNEIDHQVPKGMAKTDYVGNAIMRLKQLADDHNMLMIVALHPPKDGVEKRLHKNALLTLNDGADSANWGNKADIGFCMWRSNTGPTYLHIDKVKDHETMGRPNLCEMIHDPVFNRFRVGRIGYELLAEAGDA